MFEKRTTDLKNNNLSTTNVCIAVAGELLVRPLQRQPAGHSVHQHLLLYVTKAKKTSKFLRYEFKVE